MIILCNNNKQASPLRLEFGTEDERNTAKRPLQAQTGFQIPILQVEITLSSFGQLILSVQPVLWSSRVLAAQLFSHLQPTSGFKDISPAPAPRSCLIGSRSCCCSVASVDKHAHCPAPSCSHSTLPRKMLT